MTSRSDQQNQNGQISRTRRDTRSRERRSSQLAGASQAAALTNGFHLAFLVCCGVLAAATVLAGLGITGNAGIPEEGTPDRGADADADQLYPAAGLSGQE